MTKSIFLACALFIATLANAATSPPNVIVILCDDQGYADVHCFGGQVATPNIDRMATEGMRFTHFYVGQRRETHLRSATSSRRPW